MMDTLFFVLSKILWPLMQPDALLLYVLLAVLVLIQRGKLKAAKWLTAVSALILMVIAVFPIGDWMLYRLESRFPPNPPLPRQVDGIIVLGGTIDALSSVEWDQVELTASADRLIAFAALANRYPRAQLVMSGGSGDIMAQDYREADVAEGFFQAIGLDTRRVILERESRNTMENVVYSRELAKPTAGENWIVVTSAFHMPRTMGIFCKQQWQIIPWPVDHYTSAAALHRLYFNLLGNLQMLILASHEWAGLFAYRMTGKTSALFPADCNWQ
jgi:uncharacterized SAM-binding protein YcdF (DUF218 family)